MFDNMTSLFNYLNLFDLLIFTVNGWDWFYKSRFTHDKMDGEHDFEALTAKKGLCCLSNGGWFVWNV